MAVLGPSGCGKSTLLGIIAGLEKPDRGEVCWAGASLTGLPTHQRGFGLMFQDFALFPHQDVFENIAFGLRMAGYPRAEDQRACGPGAGAGRVARFPCSGMSIPSRAVKRSASRWRARWRPSRTC